MTFIIKNIPRDDVGVQSLRSDNARPSAAEAPRETPPYPPIHAEEGVKPVAPDRDRRHRPRDRRAGQDRRGKKNEVLLDTRSGRERRRSAIDRRTGKPLANADQKAPKIGIDIKI